MEHQLVSKGLDRFGVVIASSMFAGAVVVRPNFHLTYGYGPFGGIKMDAMDWRYIINCWESM
jgi:hypothetical protein